MFIALRCKCADGHEWDTLLPKYWFSLERCTCPECNKPVVSMRSGNPVSHEEIRARAAVRRPEALEDLYESSP